MTTTRRFNKDGQEVPNVGPLLDGQVLRTSMSMMDAAHEAHLRGQTVFDTDAIRHSPGFAAVTDAELVNGEAAIAARKQALSEAWKSPPAKPVMAPFKRDETPATDTESLLQARDKRLTEAWRTPPAPLPTSTTIDTPPPPATLTAADVDAAIERRNSRLENAWRGAA